MGQLVISRMSVAMAGDAAAVDAYGNDDAGSDSGLAYIFSVLGGSWPQVAKLLAADGAACLTSDSPWPCLEMPSSSALMAMTIQALTVAISISNVYASTCLYEALMYVGFPAQTLRKSFMMPVML